MTGRPQTLGQPRPGLEPLPWAGGPIRVLADDLVLVDWGPMTLTISAWDQGLPRPVAAARAAGQALECLAVLADFQGFLKRPGRLLPAGRRLPRVVARALEAVRAISGELTPLAAVAGAVADQVADLAAGLGLDKVIVNNGGDVALRLARGQSALVGLKAPGSDRLLGWLAVAAGTGLGGVASSGWSGRSFSPGVADLVTVWAESGALADAAATWVAARTSLTSPRVRQVRAASLDPQSDLADLAVTEEVQTLTRAERRRALAAGLGAARSLLGRGLIGGTFLSVQGESAALDPGQILSLEPV